MALTTIIIGGGIAGMAAASRLASLGENVILLEKEEQTGGHVRNWDRLFPTRRPAQEVLNALQENLKTGIEIRYNQKIRTIEQLSNEFRVILEKGEPVAGQAILLTTGFNLFDAHKKEEYGYGIYDNVITSAELEILFRSGNSIKTLQGRIPKRIGFVHCVGSRDEKAGNLYCSKVCCVTGVKQAIEIKEQIPYASIYNFYMDLRMFDRHFEELYFEAQQRWGINFMRGRVSECAENQDHSICLKIEDTLTSRPLKMTVDLLVLLVGFVPSSETERLAGILELPAAQDRFLDSVDGHLFNNRTRRPGIFIAGAVKGPSCISNTIADAANAAAEIHTYLKNL